MPELEVRCSGGFTGILIFILFFFCKSLNGTVEFCYLDTGRNIPQLPGSPHQHQPVSYSAKSMHTLPCHLCGIFLEVVLKAILVSPFELQHEKSPTGSPTGSGV